MTPTIRQADDQALRDVDLDATAGPLALGFPRSFLPPTSSLDSPAHQVLPLSIPPSCPSWSVYLELWILCPVPPWPSAS